MRDAACADSLVQFFPERGEDARSAKDICAACVVREECLGYALAHGIDAGIWGGTSARERRRLSAETSALTR